MSRFYFKLSLHEGGNCRFEFSNTVAQKCMDMLCEIADVEMLKADIKTIDEETHVDVVLSKKSKTAFEKGALEVFRAKCPDINYN